MRSERTYYEDEGSWAITNGGKCTTFLLRGLIMKKKLEKLNKEIWDLCGRFSKKEKINIKSISINAENSEYTFESLKEKLER